MRIQRSASVAAIVVLAALPILASGAVAAGTVTAQAARERAEHDRIVAYWTPARVRSAVPRDFVRDGSGFHPAKGKPGGGTGGTTGASWPNGRGKVYAVTGKVLFTMGGSQLRLQRHGARRQPRRDLRARGHGRALRLRRDRGGARALRHELALHPAVRQQPDVHLRQHGVRLLDGEGARRQQRVRSAGSFNNQATRYDWAFAVVGGGGKTAGANIDLDALGTFADDGPPSMAAQHRRRRLRLPGGGQVPRQRSHVLPGPDVGFDADCRHEQLPARLRHDRRLVRRPVAGRRGLDRQRRHDPLAQLVRLRRVVVHVRPDLQQHHDRDLNAANSANGNTIVQ